MNLVGAVFCAIGMMALYFMAVYITAHVYEWSAAKYRKNHPEPKMLSIGDIIHVNGAKFLVIGKKPSGGGSWEIQTAKVTEETA
jgi:hypothetical protein